MTFICVIPLKLLINHMARFWFDWAFSIRRKLRGHLQLFDGYGENLIDYNHHYNLYGFGCVVNELVLNGLNIQTIAVATELCRVFTVWLIIK